MSRHLQKERVMGDSGSSIISSGIDNGKWVSAAVRRNEQESLEEKGKRFVLDEKDDGRASASEIEKETEVPFTAKERVEKYLSQTSDRENERVELHPEESRASKIFKNKPGRILKPLGWTLQVGGGVALAVGIAGIFTGLPGFILAGAGLGGALLGDHLAKKGIQRKMGANKDILERAENLEGTKTRDELTKDINSWFEGTGKKSLQRIKFEILEAEIRFSDEISHKDKVKLLKKFTDKQVSHKQYQALFKKFSQFKEVYSQYPEQLKRMFDVESELDFENKVAKLKSEILKGRFDIDDETSLNSDTENGKEKFIKGLLDLVSQGGKKEYAEFIENCRADGKKDSQIWKSLAALAAKDEKKLKILDQKAENLLLMIDEDLCQESDVKVHIAKCKKEFIKTGDEGKFFEDLVAFVREKGKHQYLLSAVEDKNKSAVKIWEVLSKQVQKERATKKGLEKTQNQEEKLRSKLFSSIAGFNDSFRKDGED